MLLVSKKQHSRIPSHRWREDELPGRGAAAVESVTVQETMPRAPRRPGRWTALSLAAACALTLGASSCDDPTGEKSARVEVCAKVLGQTFFNPFPQDAEKAREDVRARADRLDELAEETSDSELREAIASTAKSLREADPKGGGATTVVGYLSEQNDRLRELRKPCTDFNKQ